MGLIVTNPEISLQANNGSPRIYYFADGAALFGCIGSPEGVIVANARSIAITETGAVYVKTTNGVATGWSAVGGGGGGSINGSIAATQVAVGGGSNIIAGSSALTFTTGGLSNLQSIEGECGFLANQAVSGTASSAYFYMQTPSSAGILRLTTAGFTPTGLIKANQVDIYGGSGAVEMLLRLQDASTRFVFGINNGEAMSVNSTTTENLALGSPSTGAVPRNAQIKFYNATNAFYTQLRATAFAANRIWDLPTGSPTGTQALVGTLSGSTITLDWQSVSSPLTSTQIGFGSGSNLLTGSADFVYTDSTGVIELTKALNSSVRLVVTNGAGTTAQARIAVASNVSGAALAAYSSNFTTSGLITANSVVLDMDGPTAMILAQSGGTFKIGLGLSTEHLRLTSTVFTLFGPNTGSVTGITVTSAAVGSGVTISTTSSGTNEDMTLSPKGTGAINFTGAMKAPNGSASTPTYGFTNVPGGGFYFGGAAGRFILAAGGSAQLEFANTLVTAGSSLHYGWGSSSSPSGVNPDTSWTRFGAAVIRAANGSTGAGQLLLGTSTDTADAQLSIYSQATNRASIKVRALTGTLGSQTAFESYDAANALTFWVTTAGNVRLGGADTASPGSFNLSVQNVLSGTSNTSGQNFSIIGCAGTGNQPGGQIILRVAPAGSSGTTPNTTIVGLAVTGSGQVYGAALHNNSAGMSGTTNQYIGSGTYTPTITAVANCTASAAGTCSYMRIGNIVTVSGQVTVDPTTTLTLTQVGISLPIASALVSSNQCNGTACNPLDYGEVAAIAGDGTNDRAELQCTPTAVASRVWSFTFTYEVL